MKLTPRVVTWHLRMLSHWFQRSKWMSIELKPFRKFMHEWHCASKHTVCLRHGFKLKKQDDDYVFVNFKAYFWGVWGQNNSILKTKSKTKFNQVMLVQIFKTLHSWHKTFTQAMSSLVNFYLFAQPQGFLAQIHYNISSHHY